ncbi:MAG: hypothetical protein KatS3mg105_0154 [Gemmatales bacterium]|nr:MAG: hypothetical protein KatS3mg105_0154 [Gemmatales bacterium]
MRQLFSVVMAFVCWWTLPVRAEPVQSGKLYAGWAQRDLSPKLPAPLAGQRRLRIARKIRDPLTCTALALETRDGDKPIDQVIWLSCDLLAIRGDVAPRLRQRLRKSLPEVDPLKLIVHATHTHTSPVLEEGSYDIPKNVLSPREYELFVVEQAEQAVVQAWKSRAPAAMSWGLGHAVVGHNRRAVFANGKAIMYGPTARKDFREFEGYEDHGVELLFFWDADKNLTGIVVNVACPAQETEGLSEVSADFWHETRLALRKEFGDKLFVLPQCAAAGDISPHLMYRKKAEDRMRQRRGLDRRQEIARRIARAVTDVFPYCKEARTSLELAHVTARIDLPVRQVTKAEYEQAQELLKEWSKPKPGAKWMVNRQKQIIERYRTQKEKTTYPVELHVVRLGEVALATNPFELFLDFGLRMKTRSQAVMTMTVQLAGYGTYVPTEKAVRGGGYSAEVASNLVGPKGGQVLVEETVKRINALWE